MKAEIKICNLFSATEKYLCHQTNCITNRSAHLAASMFKMYPYADIYSARQNPDTPGTIIIKGNGIEQRFVINMLGQYYPGSPKFVNSSIDGKEVRQKYFFKCLKAIAKIEDLESVAFPWRVGCGAAGGDWEFYHGLIDKFADHVQGKASVSIYRLPE